MLCTPRCQPSPPARDLTDSASLENSVDFTFQKKMTVKRLGFLQEGKGNKKRFSLNSSLSFLLKFFYSYRAQGQLSESQSNLNKCMCLTDLHLFRVKFNPDIASLVKLNNSFDRVYLSYFLRPYKDNLGVFSK